MRARHGALTANQVATIDLGSIPISASIYVVNVSASSPFYVRLDGVDPTVMGEDCRVVLSFRRFPARSEFWNGSLVQQVKMICAEDATYAVEVGR